MNASKISELERLVAENYHGLTKQSGAICLTMVQRFLDENPSVLDKKLLFIKKLVKVGWLIYQRYPKSLDNQLQSLFDYSIEGIEKIRTGHIDQDEQESLARRIPVINAHLHLYAANFAAFMYRKTHEELWLNDWYEMALKSAKLHKKIGDNNVFISLFSASEAAYLLYKKGYGFELALESARLLDEYYSLREKMQFQDHVRSSYVNRQMSQLRSIIGQFK